MHRELSLWLILPEILPLGPQEMHFSFYCAIWFGEAKCVELTEI
jgi:hypothetical protein